jgi:curved DNA-binding protein CbpA
MDSMKHSEILGVNPDANAKEINQAYRKAAKEVHPDVSNSPEAAQAFDRINKARDALLAHADTAEDIESIRRSTASAASATAATAFTPPPKMTDEEIARIQELDQQASKKPKFSFFRRDKEPEEVKRHRRSIKTNEQRLNGKY